MNASMSKMEALLACVASSVLPQEDRDSDAARDGNERHALLAQRVLQPNVGIDAGKHADWLQRLEEAAIIAQLQNMQPEVAVAYDVAFDDARILGMMLDRNYGDLAPSAIPGTADFVRFDGTFLSIVDLKTGRGEVTPPSRNAQLRTLALAFARAHRFKGPVDVLLLLAPEGVEPRLVEHTWRPEELDEWATTLGNLWVQATEAEEDLSAGRPPRHLKPGAHCRYCPALGSCPSASLLATRAAVEPTFRARWQQAMLEGQARDVYTMKRVLEAEVAAMDEALREQVRATGPLDLGDGREYRLNIIEREELDASVAYRVLAERYGAEVAQAAMTLDTSKAGIERGMRVAQAAAKAAGQKATLKALQVEALEAVRAAGGVKVKTSERFEENKRA